jgi:hypothetical protein
MDAGRGTSHPHIAIDTTLMDKPHRPVPDPFGIWKLLPTKNGDYQQTLRREWDDRSLLQAKKKAPITSTLASRY